MFYQFKNQRFLCILVVAVAFLVDRFVDGGILNGLLAHILKSSSVPQSKLPELSKPMKHKPCTKDLTRIFNNNMNAKFLMPIKITIRT
jgi:hypothetical protein